jgi:hypothetical protein
VYARARVLCLLDAGSALDVKRLNGETKLALLDRRSIQRRVEAEAGFSDQADSENRQTSIENPL